MKVIFDTEKETLEDLKKVLEVVKEAISKKENGDKNNDQQNQKKEVPRNETKPRIVEYDLSAEKKLSEIFSSSPLTRKR